MLLHKWDESMKSQIVSMKRCSRKKLASGIKRHARNQSTERVIRRRIIPVFLKEGSLYESALARTQRLTSLASLPRCTMP